MEDSENQLDAPRFSISWIGASSAIAATAGVLSYYRIDHNELDLVTGMLFLAAAFSCLIAALEIGGGALKIPPSMLTNLRILALTTFTLVVALELILRFGITKYPSYLEANGFPNYESGYGQELPTWFWTFRPNEPRHEERPEYVLDRDINDLGLPERDFPQDRKPDEFRVIALGDSFTEGVGTTYDSTWVRVVEHSLGELMPGRTVTAFDAGVSGSDPFFEYILLRERLAAYNPDLVIVAINNSDAYDVSVRGGMGRFLDNGTTRFMRQAPPWEWLYGISFITRHFVHDVLLYDLEFRKHGQQERYDRESVDLITEAIDSLNALATARGFELLVAVHPVAWELRAGYARTMNWLLEHCREKADVVYVDIREDFLETGTIPLDSIDKFYWPIDAHHTTRGYKAMGDAITRALLANRLIDVDSAGRTGQ